MKTHNSEFPSQNEIFKFIKEQFKRLIKCNKVKKQNEKKIELKKK